MSQPSPLWRRSDGAEVPLSSLNPHHLRTIHNQLANDPWHEQRHLLVAVAQEVARREREQ